jgi:capsular exopolysaccharide synthesis family protein
MWLRREVAVADNLYRTLQSRYAEARLAEASATPDIAVLDTAVAPQHAENSKAWRLVLMIVVGSIGLALCLAIVLDHLDRRFRYPEQATHELHLPIVGTIPALAQRRRSPDPIADIQVVESFRALRLQLQHMSRQLPLTITITSPGSGDGKSLLSANLALSFADAGYHTLLVDGDIRRGTQHTVFGASVQPGLLNHLTGQVNVDQILQPTPHDKLRFVSRGTRIQGGPELLASAQMASLMSQLRTRFDAIVIDSPPLGAGIDPLALAVHTRNLLMVLRIGETDRKLALAKLQAVSRLPINVLGAVLNEVPAEGVYKYYAYGYGEAGMATATGSLVSGLDPFEKVR